MKSKRLCSLVLCGILLFSLLFAFTGCEKKEAEQPVGEATLADYNGKPIGVIGGSVHEKIAAERFPDSPLSYYRSMSELAQATKSGIIDGFTCDIKIAREICREIPTLCTLSVPVGELPCAFAFPKSEKGVHLQEQMNEFLQKCHTDGTMDVLDQNWLADNPDEKPIDMSGLDNADAEKLVFVTTAMSPPFSYMLNDAVSGYDVDLAVRFCREYGYAMDIKTADFDAVAPGLQGGTYDFAGNCIIVTDERKESMNFSDTVYALGMVLVVRNTKATDVGFFEKIQSSFEKTFIREERWKMIVRGVEITVFIAVFSALFGTLLGFLLCFCRRMKNPVIHAATTVYIRIMQGMPHVVLLMILFYLVFAGSGLPAEWVAIIAFSLNFSAYVCEIVRAGIASVDRGQTEAALAIGCTRAQAFFRIILPQAATNFLPVYKGEFITLVKMTSIVGYIAVEDLTKAGDLIRSRTYEAFFPLIVTAIIYFLISGLFILLLRFIEIRIEPKRKNRKVKGVKTK